MQSVRNLLQIISYNLAEVIPADAETFFPPFFLAISETALDKLSLLVVYFSVTVLLVGSKLKN